MSNYTLQALRILVVDDDADSRDFMTVALEGEGAEVKAVGSVAEALTTIEDWRPDVLVSDIRMPDEDGYHLMRQVRKQSVSNPADRLPIGIALTAFARDEDREEALSAGYQAHLPKPVDLAELYRTIAQLTGRPVTDM
jgi:two-component system, OmpR family, response regulator